MLCFSFLNTKNQFAKEVSCFVKHVLRRTNITPILVSLPPPSKGEFQPKQSGSPDGQRVRSSIDNRAARAAPIWKSIKEMNQN